MGQEDGEAAGPRINSAPARPPAEERVLKALGRPVHRTDPVSLVPDAFSWARSEEDIEAARSLAALAEPKRDAACFHCQQSAEKHLKALLQEFGLVVPRTHDLSQLFPRDGWPDGCGRGAINVHVRQRSTGRDAAVEFSLDPNAAGAGCCAV